MVVLRDASLVAWSVELKAAAMAHSLAGRMVGTRAENWVMSRAYCSAVYSAACSVLRSVEKTVGCLVFQMADSSEKRWVACLAGSLAALWVDETVVCSGG